MPAVNASGSVIAEPGRGGLERLVVSTASASAEIHLQGAHVTAWTPQGHDPVIWMSQRSAFAPGTPIRGGIPVCFPWFGPGPTPEAGLHGFVRTTPWHLLGAVDDGDGVVVTLGLSDADIADASAWPHPFQARYVVAVGPELTVALSITNTGTAPITFAESLHTYLAVGDVRQARITGLEELAYTDRLGTGDQPQAGEALRVTAETDRVYPQPGEVAVVDPAKGRTLTVRSTGSGNAVIWNPWVAKAAAMGDFGDEEWPEMVCVETCNVLDHDVTLAPRETATMTATYSVARNS